MSILNKDFQKLSVEGLITLYQLDATKLGAGILYLHGHTNYEDWLTIQNLVGDVSKLAGDNKELAGHDYDVSDTEKELHRDIVFNGITYSPVAIKSDGLEMRGDGKASNPTLAIANNVNGVQGAISAYCLKYSDFAGARLTVIQTLAKYLDAENFAEGNPQAQAEYKKQVWYVEQKTSENAIEVNFELSNPIDFEGLRIPVREINNYCQWAINGCYRGDGCGYTGTKMFDENDKETDNPELDICSGRLKACKLRHGDNTAIPFGGFPSSSLINK